jgi:hypothetical protein
LYTIDARFPDALPSFKSLVAQFTYSPVRTRIPMWYQWNSIFSILFLRGIHSLQKTFSIDEENDRRVDSFSVLLLKSPFSSMSVDPCKISHGIYIIEQQRMHSRLERCMKHCSRVTQSPACAVLHESVILVDSMRKGAAIPGRGQQKEIQLL